ncbi:hypothetical protein LEP1GSC169_3430 [Leptospira santarosai str. HAI1349]|nr:hypothetical protein LEP1GSC169_3430 [Leptospira santarosai str. HAI1349]EMP79332.1 hypothetical protein LEP1GSC162_2522 [Leptospira santarosai str. CBC1531]
MNLRTNLRLEAKFSKTYDAVFSRNHLKNTLSLFKVLIPIILNFF